MAERLFSEFLAQHAGGETDLRLTTELREALAAVKREERKATVTLTTTITPKGRVIEISLGVGSKLPAPQPESYMYFDDNGYPATRDPRQLHLPLHRLEDLDAEEEETHGD